MCLAPAGQIPGCHYHWSQIIPSVGATDGQPQLQHTGHRGNTTGNSPIFFQCASDGVSLRWREMTLPSRWSQSSVTLCSLACYLVLYLYTIIPHWNQKSRHSTDGTMTVGNNEEHGQKLRTKLYLFLTSRSSIVDPSAVNESIKIATLFLDLRRTAAGTVPL